MRIFTRVLLATILLGGATTALSSTHSYFDKEYAFSAVRTFDFKDQQRISEDPIADNRIWANQIKAVLELNLQAHGFELTAGGRPDVLVAFYVGLKEREDVAVMGYGFPGYWGSWRYGWHWGWDGGWGWPGPLDVWTIPYTESTLIVDVVDARTNQLVWRGFNTDLLDLSDVEEDFQDAVHDVLKRFYKDIRLDRRG